MALEDEVFALKIKKLALEKITSVELCMVLTNWLYP